MAIDMDYYCRHPSRCFPWLLYKGFISPDPKAFKPFVGCVLYIGLRLLKETIGKTKPARHKGPGRKFMARAKKAREKQRTRLAAGLPPEAVVKTISISFKKIEYEFWGEKFSLSLL